MVHYFKFKRQKIDRCNICLAQSELTWDHIPPKGGIELSEVEQVNIVQHLTDNKNQKFVLSQNGVKYRTICKNCNNFLLGSQYDPILNAFANELGQLLKTPINIPNVVKLRTQPGRLVKAVVGHMLAAKGEIENSLIDERLRDYFLDTEMNRLLDYKLFFWVYPFKSIKIIRDFGMTSVRGDFSSQFTMFSTLRYFPIAYLLTDAEQYCGLDEMTAYCTNNIDDEVEIPIVLSNVFSEDWPEYGENNFIMGGQSLESGVSAVPRRIRLDHSRRR